MSRMNTDLTIPSSYSADYSQCGNLPELYKDRSAVDDVVPKPIEASNAEAASPRQVASAEFMLEQTDDGTFAHVICSESSDGVALAFREQLCNSIV
ncbi:hypothetical protein Syun_031495 [Stephania yunnanensis]|uniref:Uncharacterized protein n=1 Tax=Stephania yunnanensis TaxID=152371 RepID=A0AAP0HF10_9MAGN